jgi:5-(carboxyamino)imidazole ribonucleotide mutase
MAKTPKVAIVMGSDSDMPVLESCLATLRTFGVDVEVRVCSAHRTPDKAAAFARNAEADGVDVIIAAAGKAAHLPGVLAAFTVLPVIGLPILSSTLDGLDSLLSIVQMPAGVPVATVAINGSENAALLAVQIMGGAYPELRSRMHAYKKGMAEVVEAKDRSMQVRVGNVEGNV